MATADDIKKASEALEKFGKAAGAAGSTLKKADQLADLAGNLSKFSAGLGMMGAGVGMLSFALGAKSDTDRILGAIKDLSKQVKDLQTRMDKQFDNLKNVIDETAAKGKLFDATKKIENTRNLIATLQKQLAKDQSFKSPGAREARKILLQTEVNDLSEAAEAIHKVIAEEHSRLSIHLLLPIYNRTYGDARVINEVCAGLFSQMTFCVAAHVLIRTLKWKPDEDESKAGKTMPTEEDVAAITGVAQDVYHDLLKDVVAAWKKMIHECMRNANVKQNAELKLRDVVAKRKGEMFTKHYPERVDLLLKELAGQFFWLDWVVIICDPVEGSNKHGVWGSNLILLWRHEGYNINVHWVEKSSPAKGSTWSTKAIGGYEWSEKQVVGNVPVPITRKADVYEDVPMQKITNEELYKKLKRPRFVWRAANRTGNITVSATSKKRYTFKKGKAVNLVVGH